MKNWFFILFFILPSIACSDTDLQRLLDEASKGGGEVHLNKRTYTLNRPLKIPSNVKIYGNGATLEPSNDWGQGNGSYLPLLEIVNVSNVHISNLTFDHKAEYGSDDKPSYSLLILKSTSIEIDNNRFKNLGKKRNSKSVHGSPFILIAAQEQENDFSYIPQQHKRVMGSVENVRITNNSFVNGEYVNSFAIRLVTLWTEKREKSSIQHRIRDIVVADNEFHGEYDWNTLELAGPGTLDIRVERNLFSGKSVNNIDIDKGASNVVVSNNTLTDLGLPSRHKSNKSVRVSPIMVHGNSGGYECENIRVVNNVIDGITNPDVTNSQFIYSSGIGVLNSRDVEIRGNRMTNIFSGKNYGAAICLDQSISDIKIINNYINNAYRGIIVTPNTKQFDNIQIEDNEVNAHSEPVMILSREKGQFSRLKVKNNKVKSEGNKRVKFSKNILEVDSDVK